MIVKPSAAHVEKWGAKLAARLAASTNRAAKLGIVLTASYLDDPYARHAASCECTCCRENRAIKFGPNWMESGVSL